MTPRGQIIIVFFFFPDDSSSADLMSNSAETEFVLVRK